MEDQHSFILLRSSSLIPRGEDSDVCEDAWRSVLRRCHGQNKRPSKNKVDDSQTLFTEDAPRTWIRLSPPRMTTEEAFVDQMSDEGDPAAVLVADIEQHGRFSNRTLTWPQTDAPRLLAGSSWDE